jgi:hypothetical protein
LELELVLSDWLQRANDLVYGRRIQPLNSLKGRGS